MRLGDLADMFHRREDPFVPDCGQRQRALRSGRGRAGTHQHRQLVVRTGHSELTRRRVHGGQQRDIVRALLQRRAQVGTDPVVGLTTSVIRELLPCVEGPGPELEHCATPTLADQLHSLDRRISTLQNARTALAHLLATTAERPG
nr:hypothetical protein [Micromonospora craniellae]